MVDRHLIDIVMNHNNHNDNDEDFSSSMIRMQSSSVSGNSISDFEAFATNNPNQRSGGDLGGGGGNNTDSETTDEDVDEECSLNVRSLPSSEEEFNDDEDIEEDNTSNSQHQEPPPQQPPRRRPPPIVKSRRRRRRHRSSTRVVEVNSDEDLTGLVSVTTANRRRRQMIEWSITGFLFCVIVILLTVLTVLLVGRINKPPKEEFVTVTTFQPTQVPTETPTVRVTQSPTQSPTDVPSPSPTASPTASSAERLKQLIYTYDWSNPTTLQDPNTPQYKAWMWMADDVGDDFDLPQTNGETRTIRQRYVMAVFFFSTIGQFWAERRRQLGGETLEFLSSSNVCDWNNGEGLNNLDDFEGILCNDDGAITGILLGKLTSMRA